MPILSEKDAYFVKNGPFAKKYGTFVEAPVLGGHIAEAINGRSPERMDVFEQSIDNLVDNFLQNHPAKEAFLTLLDDLRAEGLVEMVLRKEDHLEYHIAEHAVEVADDTGQVIHLEFKKSFPEPEQEIANEILIALSKAAGAWHDVVQNAGPPTNEIESAKDFVHRMKARLKNYKNKFHEFPALVSAIKQFQNQLDFISKELIVYSTWLVVGMENGRMVAKTLNERINNIKPDLDCAFVADKNSKEFPHFCRLLMASDVISDSDTRRFSFRHVKDARILLNALKSFTESELLQGFFAKAEIIKDEDKEVFLGLLCQNMRIFPELNRPEKSNVPKLNVAIIEEADHKEFLRALDSARSEASEDKIDYENILKVFLKTKNTSRKDNVVREMDFAKAQQHPMWTRHAGHLEIFSQYVFSKDFGHASRAILGRMLTILSTQFQHGSILLKNDINFHDKLKHKANSHPTGHAKKNLKIAAQRFLTVDEYNALFKSKGFFSRRSTYVDSKTHHHKPTHHRSATTWTTKK